MASPSTRQAARDEGLPITHQTAPLSQGSCRITPCALQALQAGNLATVHVDVGQHRVGEKPTDCPLPEASHREVKGSIEGRVGSGSEELVGCLINRPGIAPGGREVDLEGTRPFIPRGDAGNAWSWERRQEAEARLSRPEAGLEGP